MPKFSQLFALLLASSSLAHAQAPARIIPDQYIVLLKNGRQSSVVAARHGLGAQFEYRSAANGFAATLPKAALQRLKQDPDVEMIIPDREVQAIGKPGGGGGGGRGGGGTISTQVIPAGVQRIGALGLAYKGAGVGVAVVDTGIDLANSDLAVGSKSYSAVSPSANDDNGHGTHVSGIIAAKDNTVGVIGVAPQATVYAVKVLDRSGSGSDSTVLAGLDWVAKNAKNLSPAIRVVNMSLGRAGTLNDNPAYRSAVQTLTQQGIVVVVAAGNDATKEVSQMVPATYPEVIAVASTTANNGASAYPGFSGITADTASFFTTDGALVTSPDGKGLIGVSISAPGEDQEDVGSTGTINAVGILSLKVGGGTTRMAGTSMAAPHTAGVATLLQQQGAGSFSVEDIRRKIMNGAANISAPYASPTSTYTFDGDLEGILNAPGALNAL